MRITISQTSSGFHDPAGNRRAYGVSYDRRKASPSRLAALQPTGATIIMLSPSPFLRQALLADAVTTTLCGSLMLLGAHPLAGMLGLPEILLRIGGAALLPFAALVAYLSLRPTIPRVAVWAVILVNVLWVAESVLLLVSGWVRPNAAGYVFVLAQAAVVLMYAELQYMGLRRSGVIAI
jgi:hypothetical protein